MAGNNSDCPDAEIFQNYKPLTFVLIEQVILCITTIVTTVIYIRKYMMSEFYHPNFRTLMMLYLSSFIIYSGFLGAIQSYHIIAYTFFEPCDLYVSATVCYIMRHPTISCTTLMSTTQFVLTLERCFAAYKGGQYEKFTNRVGILIATATVFVSELFTLALQWCFPLKTPFLLCTGSAFFGPLGTIGVFGQGDLWLFSCMFLDCVTLTILLALSIHCYIVRKKLVRKSFNLAHRFENHRNLNVLAGLVPTMIFHAIYSIGYMALQMWMQGFQGKVPEIQFRSMSAGANVITVYTTIAPLLMMYLQYRHRKQSKVQVQSAASGEHYFKTYTTMWK